MPGSRLGRDLDLEDAAVAERAILGASGPFATVAEVGRYATLLPVDVRNGDLVTVSARVLSALQKGLGFAVEIEPRHAARRAPERPDPREGRNDENEKRGGRRRRRKAKRVNSRVLVSASSQRQVSRLSAGRTVARSLANRAQLLYLFDALRFDPAALPVGELDLGPGAVAVEDAHLEALRQ